MTTDAQPAVIVPEPPAGEQNLPNLNDVWTEQFISRVCHETRTPLNAILGFSSLMSSGGTGSLTDQQREFTQHIEEAGEKLLSMICDLADIARYRLDRLDLDIESVNLSAMMSRLETRFRTRTKGQTQVFTVISRPGLAIRADRDRLCRVLCHLLSNAFQYNRQKGFVALSAADIGDKVRITVSDGGRGFSEDETRMIFGFHRCAVDQARSGSGLGLPTSYFLIKAMGGRLEVETKIGEGSTFTIELDKAENQH